MNSLQAPSIVDIVIEGGISAAILLAIIGGLIWFFRSLLGGYLKTKAENFATKQDIHKLTRLQEEVKSEFHQLLERQRAEGQLRIAVVEKRFQKHQDAHALWHKLFNGVYTRDNVKNVMECQTWWQGNSLYLDKDARTAFIRAVNAAYNHSDLLQGERDEVSVKLIKGNWKQITAAGAIIENAVHLPSLQLADIKTPGNPEPTAFGDGIDAEPETTKT